MQNVGYYPGCGLKGSGAELDRSIRAVARAAEVDLVEIGDWNCCGAAAAHNLSHQLAVALPYRALALAEEQGLTRVLAPCSACFSRLKGTNVRVKRSAELANQMAEVTECTYGGSVEVISIHEFLLLLLGAGLAEKLPKRLTGLRVAAYYGCLLSRGENSTAAGDADDPMGMHAAIRAAGAEPVAWNSANECCGGGFSLSKVNAALGLPGRILQDAAEAGAEAVVTGCPTCHSVLDKRRQVVARPSEGRSAMPVLYLSELLGLAAGLDATDVRLRSRVMGARVAANKISDADDETTSTKETASVGDL